MKRCRRLLVLGLCLAALPPIAADAEATLPASGRTEAELRETGEERQFYFCAAFQAVKIVGLFTANAPLVLVGAIGGGLSCGFGW